MANYRPEEVFSMNLATFKFFGVWPSGVKNPVLRFIYKIYGNCFCVLYMMGIMPPQLIHIYINRNDIQKVIDSCFFALSCAGYITKLMVFLKHRQEIEEFFERLREPIFTPKRHEDLIVVKNFTLMIKVCSIAYVSLTSLTVGTWILYPLVDNRQEKVLLFAAWYPYNATSDTAYGYTYVFQTLLLCTTALMNSQLDMLTVNLYVLMVAQLELLKQDFRELADVDEINNNVLKTNMISNETVTHDMKFILYQEDKFSDLSNSEENMQYKTKNNFTQEADLLDKILNNRVIKCTKRYEAIVQFVNDVTDLFEIGVLAQICVSSIIICATSYEMTAISPTTLQFYVVLQYQVCMLFQIFIYTWRGNEITVKTAELKDAVYECAWISVPNTKFRKSLCIIMSPLQVPVQICIGKFFLLSVDMFFKIIKLAYSFYIVLKQMNS